jgi:hypothetical protein
VSGRRRKVIADLWLSRGCLESKSNVSGWHGRGATKRTLRNFALSSEENDDRNDVASYAWVTSARGETVNS